MQLFWLFLYLTHTEKKGYRSPHRLLHLQRCLFFPTLHRVPCSNLDGLMPAKDCALAREIAQAQTSDAVNTGRRRHLDAGNGDGQGVDSGGAGVDLAEGCRIGSTMGGAGDSEGRRWRLSSSMACCVSRERQRWGDREERKEGRGGRAGARRPRRWTSGGNGLQWEAAHGTGASLWGGGNGGGLELRELGHLDAFGSHAKSYAYWVCFDRYQTCPYKILAWFILLLARSEVLPIKSMILSVLRPHASWFCQHTGSL